MQSFDSFTQLLLGTCVSFLLSCSHQARLTLVGLVVVANMHYCLPVCDISSGRSQSSLDKTGN
jgi:hypothetical protein